MIDRWRPALASWIALTALACDEAPLRGPPVEPPDPDAGLVADAGLPADASDERAVLDSSRDATPDAPVSTVCPAPTPVTVADLPAGFLPPVKVTLAHAVDGDTAVFTFPSSPGPGDHSCRFLFVNTEESYGTETTEFGKFAKAQVSDWLAAAKDITVVVRRDGTNPSLPNVDPYDRWLSLVFLDGELVQSRLVRAGLTPYYTQYGCAPAPLHLNLLYSEAEARGSQRGVWAPGHPTDYREVLARWIGSSTCRPNPYLKPYCP